MDNFVNAAMSAMFLTALFLIIIKLLTDLKLTKVTSAFARVSLTTVITGIIFLCGCVITRNLFYGSTDILDADKIFGAKNAVEIPFYSNAIRFIGKISGTHEYLIAFILSFALVLFIVWQAYRVIAQEHGDDSAENLFPLILTCPAFCLLFIPAEILLSFEGIMLLAAIPFYIIFLLFFGHKLSYALNRVFLAVNLVINSIIIYGVISGEGFDRHALDWRLLYLIIPYIVVLLCIALYSKYKHFKSGRVLNDYAIYAIIFISSVLFKWFILLTGACFKGGEFSSIIHQLFNNRFGQGGDTLRYLYFITEYLFVEEIVSSICFGVACCFLYATAKIEYKKESAVELLAMVVVFPCAVIYMGALPQSMFLAFTISSIYFARKKNFMLASIFGGFSAIVNVQGILILVFVIYEYFIRRQRLEKFKDILSNFKKDILWLLIIPLGMVVHLLLNDNWGGSEATSVFPQTALVFLAVIGVFYAIKCNLRTSYALYGIAYAGMMYFSGQAISGMMCCIPLFFIIAGIKNNWARFAVMFGLGIFSSVYLMYSFFGNI